MSEQKIIELKEVISNKKEDMNIQELITKSHIINNCSNDYNIQTANSSNIRFNEYAGITYIPDELESIVSSGISKHALSQLCAKIGVPAQYITKCVNNGRIDLAINNVNSWLSDYDKSLFIREHQNVIRGVLSDKYAVCDSHEILDTIEDVVDLSKYKIKGSLLNEERLHVRFVDRKPLDIEDGDKDNPGMQDLYTGFTIDSSDVGRSVLTCKFFIFKQVCTNGMIVSKFGGTLFSQKHIGITAPEFKEGLIAGVEKVAVLRDEAYSYIKENKELQSRYSSSIILSQDELDEMVKNIRLQTLLSEESARKVIDLMQYRYDSTNWGFYNAITEVAQDYTLDKRLDLETLAGNTLFA